MSDQSKNIVIVKAIGDLHGELPEIPSCDILLLAGDIALSDDIETQEKHLNGPFSKWLDEIPVEQVIGVAGNHDIALKENLAPDLNWILLEDSSIEVEGISIWGSPWVPPCYGVYQKSDTDLIETYERIPEDTDIVVSHSPPFLVGDKIFRNSHAGSKALRKKIQESWFGWVVCGHIHEDYSRHRLRNNRDQDTFVSNVSLQDDPENRVPQTMLWNPEDRSFDPQPWR